MFELDEEPFSIAWRAGERKFDSRGWPKQQVLSKHMKHFCSGVVREPQNTNMEVNTRRADLKRRSWAEAQQLQVHNKAVV